MKKITVIVQPDKFDNLKKKLLETGVSGLTVSNVEGYGFQKKKMKVLKDKDVIVDFMPKVKLEIVVAEEDVESTIDSVIDITRTGRIGDGKIFISTVDDVIRIRTGERGDDAV